MLWEPHEELCFPTARIEFISIELFEDGSVIDAVWSEEVEYGKWSRTIRERQDQNERCIARKDNPLVAYTFDARIYPQRADS